MELRYNLELSSKIMLLMMVVSEDIVKMRVSWIFGQDFSSWGRPSWKELSRKDTVPETFSLMPEVSFPSVEGFEVDDSMEKSWFSSLDAKEVLMDPDVDEVDPLMSWDEEVGSPLKGKWESLDSILIDSKESRSDVHRNDVKPLMIGKE